MNSKYDIEEERWGLLAKSIYEDGQQPTNEEQSSSNEEILFDIKDRDQIVRLAKEVDLYFELKKYPFEPAWDKVQVQIRKKSPSNNTGFRRLISNPLMRIAATLLVAALLSVGGYKVYFNQVASHKQIEISVTNQIVKTFTLPDGTLVSLNSDSHLKYPPKFDKNTREVVIEGEAFFEVMPDKNKPFIIHAGNAQIKVLGTSFNVCAYPSTKSVEVIVKTGKVQVLNKTTETKQNNELILDPGDKGTLVFSSNALLKTTNQNPNFLAWKTHDLIFRATSLGEVISDLEKVYKVNIRLDDPKLNGLLLTAHFNDYSLSFILEVIETTFKLETQIIEGQYILKEKS